jgi:hypothetical protein
VSPGINLGNFPEGRICEGIHAPGKFAPSGHLASDVMRSMGGSSSIWWTQKGGTGELGIIRICVDMDVVRIVVVLMSHPNCGNWLESPRRDGRT